MLFARSNSEVFRRRPIIGQRSARHALKLSGELRMCFGILAEFMLPFGFMRHTTVLRAPSRTYRVRNLKRRMRPFQCFSRGLGLFIAERRAVYIVRPDHVWRTPADLGAADNQRWLADHLLRFLRCFVHRLGIMAINGADHMPAIGFESRGGVIAEPAIDMTINRNAIVVIEANQLVQPPDTRE